ncbi:unnamed protein product [Urochloa decumbens]|uniref:Uncharacterized protein n=1 Tax=Urochloa decumbens TaxID=240449 RepID=A0ABC8VZ23_9POAL
MASTTSALNATLFFAAVFLVLLRPSMGHQPKPASRCRRRLPAPAPMLPPSPTLLPTPAPAPAPSGHCPSYCTSQCTAKCDADSESHCRADSVAAFNSCFGNCKRDTCPAGDSCADSGCGIGNCTCDNAVALRCCEHCKDVPSWIYGECRENYNLPAVKDCMVSCTDNCNKNCTNQA